MTCQQTDSTVQYCTIQVYCIVYRYASDVHTYVHSTQDFFIYNDIRRQHKKDKCARTISLSRTHTFCSSRANRCHFYWHPSHHTLAYHFTICNPPSVSITTEKWTVKALQKRAPRVPGQRLVLDEWGFSEQVSNYIEICFVPLSLCRYSHLLQTYSCLSIAPFKCKEYHCSCHIQCHKPQDRKNPVCVHTASFDSSCDHVKSAQRKWDFLLWSQISLE